MKSNYDYIYVKCNMYDESYWYDLLLEKQLVYLFAYMCLDMLGYLLLPTYLQYKSNDWVDLVVRVLDSVIQ